MRKIPDWAGGWNWLMGVLLFGYGVFVAMHFEPVAAGADSGGYLNSARLILRGEAREPLRTVPELPLADAGSFTYVPLGYLDEQRTGRLTPTYPVGLPLHYAAAAKLAGWWWGTLLIGVSGAVIAVAACYWGAREMGVHPWLSVAGATALAVSPLFLFVSFLPLSDTIATAWCALSAVAAIRARRTARWALACGVAFSIAVLVRPTNVLLLPAVVLILWRWRSLLVAGLAAIPGAAIALAYNQVMYGSPWRSGYGSVFESFTLGKFWPSVANYAQTLPLVLPLAVAALLLVPALGWREREDRRVLAACVVWLALFAGVYAFYEFTSYTWWYLRFLLPAFPALVILAGVGLEHLVSTVRESRRHLARAVAAVAVLAVSLGCAVPWIARYHVLNIGRDQLSYSMTSTWIVENLPKDSVVICMQMSSAIYFYTEFPILRYDQFTQMGFDQFSSAITESGRPVYAVLFPFECDEAFQRRIAGSWRKIHDVRGIGVWKLEHPSAPASQKNPLTRSGPSLPHGFHFPFREFRVDSSRVTSSQP